MKLRERLKQRRQRKEHERYLRERERQRELNAQDTEEAARNAAENWGVAGQGTSSWGN
jgi:membrane protein involved in colicin uptake